METSINAITKNIGECCKFVEENSSGSLVLEQEIAEQLKKKYNKHISGLFDVLFFAIKNLDRYCEQSSCKYFVLTDIKYGQECEDCIKNEFCKNKDLSINKYETK